jgi:hypothetical protein
MPHSLGLVALVILTHSTFTPRENAYFWVTRIEMRRFWARPTSVELSATG